MEDSIRKVASRLIRSRSAVALTGAGISVESGIPDFRSPGGLWTRYDPVEFGHIQSFLANPTKVRKMLLEIDAILNSAVPNPAHYALSELERRGILKGIITQNIDGLHQRAGSGNVVEYHGDGRSLRCLKCGKLWARDMVSFDSLPPKCACGGILRPNFVFFGESIPEKAHHAAITLVSGCDVLLVVGTSASVAPASYLPVMAKETGGFIVEINPAVTELDPRIVDIRITQPAGKALPAIVEAIDRLMSEGHEVSDDIP